MSVFHPFNDAAGLEAQKRALKSVLREYRFWHPDIDPNPLQPLKAILEVAFRTGITTPDHLSSKTGVSLKEINACLEKGEIPDKKGRRLIISSLKKDLAAHQP